jgi:predicted nucleic acid-binding protein
LSIVVIDATTVVDLICDFPAASTFHGVLASADGVAAPAHLDAEVLSALGRLQRAGHLARTAERVDAVAAFGATRWPLPPLLLPASAGTTSRNGGWR